MFWNKTQVLRAVAFARGAFSLGRIPVADDRAGVLDAGDDGGQLPGACDGGVRDRQGVPGAGRWLAGPREVFKKAS